MSAQHGVIPSWYTTLLFCLICSQKANSYNFSPLSFKCMRCFHNQMGAYTLLSHYLDRLYLSMILLKEEVQPLYQQHISRDPKRCGTPQAGYARKSVLLWHTDFFLQTGSWFRFGSLALPILLLSKCKL